MNWRSLRVRSLSRLSTILSFCVFLLQLFSFLPSSSFSASLPSSMTVKQTLTYPYLHSMVSAAAVRFASVRFDSLLCGSIHCGAWVLLWCCVRVVCSAISYSLLLHTTTLSAGHCNMAGTMTSKNPTNPDNNKTNNAKSKAQSALNAILVFQSRLCVCGHHSGQSYFS